MANEALSLRALSSRFGRKDRYVVARLRKIRLEQFLVERGRGVVRIVMTGPRRNILYGTDITIRRTE